MKPEEGSPQVFTSPYQHIRGRKAHVIKGKTTEKGQVEQSSGLAQGTE